MILESDTTMYIQQNFLNAFDRIEAFNWDAAGDRYLVGHSRIHTTNAGGRCLYIEKRAEYNDGSQKWAVIMDNTWCLTKKGFYVCEPLPDNRTQQYLDNTRFSSRNKALQALIEYEKINVGKTITLFKR